MRWNFVPIDTNNNNNNNTATARFPHVSRLGVATHGAEIGEVNIQSISAYTKIPTRVQDIINYSILFLSLNCSVQYSVSESCCSVKITRLSVTWH